MMRNYQRKATVRTSVPVKVAGFSLVEMMISVTIGMVVVAGLVGVLASNSRHGKTNDRAAELQSNGRYALDHLKDEIRQARYRGYTWARPATPASAINVTGECGGAGNGFVPNITQGIWGSNDANPFGGGDCIGSAYLRGDVLVLRRVAMIPATDCSVAPTGVSTVYFRSTYAAGMVYQGTTPPATVSGTPCGDFAVVEYVYFIGSDDADPTVPALRRIALFTDGSMQDEEVVSGIENLQVQFGRSTTDGNTRYYDANNISGTSVDSGATEWFDVDTVRLWLLARSSRAESGYSNTNTYNMGDQAYTVNDGLGRQLFTTTIQMRNFHD